MNDIYPLKFHPILKELVWGGEKIASFKGIDTNLHNVGESWELSGVKDNESIVSNGPLAGRSIAGLLMEYKETLIGRHVYDKTGDKFPLLIKFIDAAKDLSIQVHPNDALAMKRHNTNGKSEMWYVIGTSAGAHLTPGLSKEITPEEYVQHVGNNTLTEVLEDTPIQPGDVFYLPAGRIHSIGAGSFIAEIQQTSDITYRIYDYGRLDLNGKPRQLHTELAKEAIDYTVHKEYRTGYSLKENEESVLVECPYFTTSLYSGVEPFHKEIRALDSFFIVMCIEGNGSLTDDKGNKENIRQGETILIPACTGHIDIVPEGKIKFITTFA